MIEPIHVGNSSTTPPENKVLLYKIFKYCAFEQTKEYTVQVDILTLQEMIEYMKILYTKAPVFKPYMRFSLLITKQKGSQVWLCFCF